jgi:hypothetical protein
MGCSDVCGSPDPSDTSSNVICRWINDHITGIAGKNVCQCHSVTIQHNGKVCKLENQYDSNNDQPLLHSTGSSYTAYRIFSPGYFTQKCYEDNLFCAYNIQCPKNQFLYYQFSDHDIENPTSNNKCLDHITVIGDSTPNIVLPTCGRVGCNGKTYNDFGITNLGYEVNRLKVLFRSNQICSASGYLLWVFCIDIDSQGCPSSNTVKREVKNDARSEKIRVHVPLGAVLTYTNNTLSIISADNDNKTFERKNIFLLKLISTNRKKLFHNKSQIYEFYGEGQLVLYKFFAEYYFTGIPESYMLTREEAIMANKLLVQATKSFQSDESDYHIFGARNKSLEISNITLETAGNVVYLSCVNLYCVTEQQTHV